MSTSKSTKSTKSTSQLSFPEKATKELRIAAYPDSELMGLLDAWCKKHGKDRNHAIRHIMRTMLNVQDGADDMQLIACMSKLEQQVNRFQNVIATMAS